MNKPHKHCELIKAWADGQEIQYFNHSSRRWVTIDPAWNPEDLYRIKPQPEKLYVRLYKAKNGLIIDVTTLDKSSTAGIDFNWVSDWVEVELYSGDE